LVTPGKHARRVADIGGAAVRFHLQQLLEVDIFALGAQLVGAVGRRFEQRLARARQPPQRTIASSRPAGVLRTIGAMRSGQTSISGSMLPMLSTIARVAPRISSWLV